MLFYCSSCIVLLADRGQFRGLEIRRTSKVHLRSRIIVYFSNTTVCIVVPLPVDGARFELFTLSLLVSKFHGIKHGRSFPCPSYKRLRKSPCVLSAFAHKPVIDQPRSRPPSHLTPCTLWKAASCLDVCFFAVALCWLFYATLTKRHILPFCS